MKPWIDKRIERATVGFKDQIISSTALTALAECLELISDDFSDKLTAPRASDQKKGKCDNGNTGKNQKQKRTNQGGDIREI